LILAVTRRAFCVTRRATRRKLSAIAAATGAIASRISVSEAFTRSSQAVRMPSSSTWLSRLITRLTTSEKSCVSEVTRLTILPEGCSS